jgi:Minichromosome loss protein, Mcl1, middle region
VTMAGREEMAVVVFHQGRPLQDGSQCLGYMLVDILGNNIVSKGPLSCLSKTSTLTWIGLSNDKSVMAMDSNGIVSMLVKCRCNFEWMPMLDTMGLRKSRSDSFWPITVFDGKVVCVNLKGGSTYPDAARRPVTSVLGFRIPLAKAMVAKVYVSLQI